MTPAPSRREYSPCDSRANVLGELDPVGAGSFLARLDLEADTLATRERVEVHARVKAGPVEEVLLTILSRDETESPVLDQFLDCACRHRTLLFSKASRERTGPFEKIRPRRTSPGYRGTQLPYHRVTRPAARCPPVLQLLL